MIEMLELSYKKFEAGITKCFIEELQTHLKTHGKTENLRKGL